MMCLFCILESKCLEITLGTVGNGIRTVNLLMLICLDADRLSIFMSVLCWTVREPQGLEAAKVRLFFRFFVVLPYYCIKVHCYI